MAIRASNSYSTIVAEKAPASQDRKIARYFSVSIFISFFIAAAWIGYAQVRWPAAWFYLGHSLTPFLCLAAVAALGGPQREARIRVAIGLAIAVVTYYGSWALTENLNYFYLPEVLVWCIAAVPAAWVVVPVMRAALRYDELGVFWSGAITGALVADVVATKAGIPFLKHAWLAQTISSIRHIDALVIVGFAAAAVWLIFTIARRGGMDRNLWLLAPGAALGCVIAFVPLMLHSM